MTPRFALLLAFPLVAAAPAAWAQSPAAEIADSLRAAAPYPAQLRSARIEGVAVLTPMAGFYRLTRTHQDEVNSKAQHTTWAFKGDKRYSETVERFNPDKQASTYKLVTRTLTDMFDGRVHYSLVVSRYTGMQADVGQVNMDHLPMTDVPILNMGYKVFGRWVSDLLRSGRYKLAGTEHDPAFGTLYGFSAGESAGLLSRLTGQSGGERQTRFWLAPSRGFLAVRSEVEMSSPTGRQLLVYRLERAEKRGSLWFPVEGSREWYSLSGDRTTLLTVRLTVNRFELNQVPDDLFQPRLLAGYHVKDGETNRFWTIGPNGEWISIQPPMTNGPGRMPVGWLFMVSLTSFIALAAGAALRWRRRVAF